jgi:polyisoprenoid-binding protein YceI
MKPLFPILSLAGLAGLGAGLSPRAAARTPAQAAYTIDPVHSAVVFHTRHVGISEFYGRFGRISAEQSMLAYDPAKPELSSIVLVVEAGSVDTDNAERDKHLASPDFFSAKEFPEIVFESKKVAGKPEALELSGELSFHGVTKPVTANARLIGQGEVALFQDYRTGFVAELQIDMRDFGIEFVQKNPGAVGPEVTITVSLECVRKK